MNRKALALLVIVVPLLLFANVFQAFRYSRLDREVSRLEGEQQELLEENKRIILAISLLSSPQRIGELADADPGLELISTDSITRMQVPGGGGR